MSIFQEDNHSSVKFFIQRDLPDEVRAELSQTILELGGRVEEKVPRQGYVLISPGTPEGQRLRECWALPDRPFRFFVPYTFVEACKIAGAHLRQIFVENGAPMPIHIHSSIANPNARSTLSERITHSGGDPHASPQTARVVLADPNTEVFEALVKNYDGNPAVHVESYLWVKKCIEKGCVAYTPVVFKNPGGRRRGEERTQFNEKDDELLCTWIAAKIPYKEIGGRTGNRLYQQLCEMVDDPEYAWVSRHTWQSWRERYKKNADRLDNMIATIVAETKPVIGEKGQYGYVREKVPRKKRKAKDATDDEDLRADMTDLLSQKPLNILLPTGLVGHPIAGPSNAPAHAHMVANNGPEEEMDDAEEDWAIRVGDGPAPDWAKRRASQGLPAGHPAKRPRLHETHVLPPHVDPNMHVIDQAIRDIAGVFMFTVEEVQAYYDRCGEMGRTRERFGKMREMLTAHFGDDV